MPSRYAGEGEIKALIQVLTDRRGVLQIVPGENVLSFEDILLTAAWVRRPIIFSEVLTSRRRGTLVRLQGFDARPGRRLPTFGV